MSPSFLRLLLPVLFTCIQFGLFAQKLSTSFSGTTTTLTAAGLDTLTAIAGVQPPYYTYLWVFGDGSFASGTRDSIMPHVYQRRSNALYTQVGPPFSNTNVEVYMTGNYSGGSRPPRKGVIAVPPPDSFFLRSPTILRSRTSIIGGAVKDPPDPFTNTFTGAGRSLYLQLNHRNTIPGDTTVNIISFRNPIKAAGVSQPVSGQIMLFFNNKAKTGRSKLPPEVQASTKAISATPPPPKYGRFQLRETLEYYSNVNFQGGTERTGTNLEHKNLLAWDYLVPTEPAPEEYNLFAAFANDTAMWDLFRDSVGDELKFLAVQTVITGSPDILAQLPSAPTAQLEAAGLLFLQDSVYNDGLFFPPSQGAQVRVVAVSEVATPVAASHDPNHLSLFSCKCGASNRRKIMGVVEFSNDGKVASTKLKVTMKIPNQLNISSLENLSLYPATLNPNFFKADLAARTLTWEWLAALQPEAALGVGHDSTFGRIAFSIFVKDEFQLTDVEPLQACITFDVQGEMCTAPVANEDIILSTTDETVQTVLECKACKEPTPEGETCWCDPFCSWLWALGALILLVIVLIIRRLRP